MVHLRFLEPEKHRIRHEYWLDADYTDPSLKGKVKNDKNRTKRPFCVDYTYTHCQDLLAELNQKEVDFYDNIEDEINTNCKEGRAFLEYFKSTYKRPEPKESLSEYCPHMYHGQGESFVVCDHAREEHHEQLCYECIMKIENHFEFEDDSNSEEVE